MEGNTTEAFLRLVRPWCVRRLLFGEMLRELFFHIGDLGVAGQVLPLVRIVVVVVKFLAAIFVADVAVAGGADSVVAAAMRRDRRLFPLRLRVFQERQDADSFLLFQLRRAAEVLESGKN